MPNWSLSVSISELPTATHDYSVTQCVNTDDNKLLMTAFYFSCFVLRALNVSLYLTYPELGIITSTHKENETQRNK